jgi:rubrerythrin
MAEKSDDPEVKELLELLISQEVEHKKMISDRLKAIEFLKRR